MSYQHQGFKENVVIKGHVHKWTYTKIKETPVKIKPIVTPIYSRRNDTELDYRGVQKISFKIDKRIILIFNNNAL